LTPTDSTSVTWQSQFLVPGGHARLAVNGRPISETSEGVVDGTFAVAPGENRIELEVTNADAPGRWMLTLRGAKVVPGTLRVLSGSGSAQVARNGLLVPLTGRRGEKLMLAFQVSP
jgi:hypothetical protein